MNNCKIAYSGFKSADLHELCGGVITSLTGNTNFSGLPVSLVTMTAQNDALYVAMNKATDGGRTLLSKVRDAKAVVVATLKATAVSVNAQSNGDLTKLLSSGLVVNKVPEKRSAPQVVVNLKAIFTNNPGKIDLVWDKSLFAITYMVYVSADEGQTWSILNTTYTRRLLCESLVSGTRYSFKVVAMNQYGNAPVSDIASQIAA